MFALAKREDPIYPAAAKRMRLSERAPKSLSSTNGAAVCLDVGASKIKIMALNAVGKG